MLDQNIVSIAKERISLELADQSDRLRVDIDRLKNEMVARGMARSGVLLKKITELCSDTIRNRAQIAWQTLFRFVTTSSVDYSDVLANELKAIVESHLPRTHGYARVFIQDYARILNPSKPEPKSYSALDQARERALKQIHTEIDLFVLSLKNQQTDSTQGASNVFNIYSPIGSIQTGSGSTAYVMQHLDDQIRVQLSNALSQVEEAIVKLDKLPNHPKDEIMELVKESKSELEKQKPNITKLRSILSTVGASIQVVASIRPAYQVLKQTLSFLGISLP